MPAPRTVTDHRHQVDDVLTVGSTRWIIRTITDQNVTLEATNTPAGIIWRTTLDKLPTPIKEKR